MSFLQGPIGSTAASSRKASKEQRSTESSSVKVCVRIRPFINEEISRGETPTVCVAAPSRQTVEISNSEGRIHAYSFDRVYWSLSQGHKFFASQDSIFEELGLPMLQHAINGYNTCLFAYGQTGSGKSYSVIGDRSGPGRGLLPRVVEGFFDHIESLTNFFSCACTASFFEIYNEQLFDLLREDGGGPDLVIRQHPILGVIVDGLTDSPVSSKREVMKIVERGLRLRATEKTAMNEQSSRSHCIFSFKTSVLGEDGVAKMSRTHLVDLAGSERTKRTDAKGVRLKEGVAINASLSVLGRVICTLADNCDKEKKHQKLPPFRDSKLTKVLKESLCGNSKTVMIAAISPSSLDCEETMTTLRFASNAKQVRLKAVTNEVSAAHEGAFARRLSVELEGMRERLAAETSCRPLEIRRFKIKAKELKMQRELCVHAGIMLDGIAHENSASKLRHLPTFLESDHESTCSEREPTRHDVATLLPLDDGESPTSRAGRTSSLAIVGPAAEELLQDGESAVKERAADVHQALARLRKMARQAEVEFSLHGRLQLRVCVAVDPEDLGRLTFVVVAEPHPKHDDSSSDCEWFSEQELRDRLCWLWDASAEASVSSWQAARMRNNSAAIVDDSVDGACKAVVDTVLTVPSVTLARPEGHEGDARTEFRTKLQSAREELTCRPVECRHAKVSACDSFELPEAGSTCTSLATSPTLAASPNPFAKTQELRFWGLANGTACGSHAESSARASAVPAPTEVLDMSSELGRARQETPEHRHQLQARAEPARVDHSSMTLELARAREETSVLRSQLQAALERLKVYESADEQIGKTRSPSPSPLPRSYSTSFSQCNGSVSGRSSPRVEPIRHGKVNELSKAKAEADNLRRKQRATQRELSEIVLMSTRMVHAASVWRSARE
eukprot:TRINITY_DN67411_c0_g1_i1.p1 TRINITY_DN67411_c0_g1~~TRINITY_DN67411_c0_g1_i1.p1  ORF type:complete len:903 (+),score=150.35 TRINITY_DN67411_c0_g1_i1:193-2901(+)